MAILPTIIYYDHVHRYGSKTRWDLGFTWLKWEIGFGRLRKLAEPVPITITRHGGETAAGA